MKFRIISLVLIGTLLCGCVQKMQVKTKKPLVQLKNTVWKSDFYWYHNRYEFVSDSSGILYSGQIAFSCPIDLEKYHIAEDSILILSEEVFRYSIQDSSLIIDVKRDDLEKDRRILHFRKKKSQVFFVSEYEYSYGREVLLFDRKM